MSVAAAARHRVAQFLATLRARVDPAELDAAGVCLTAGERNLFFAMAVPDQRHGLDLYRRLAEAGYDQPDLLRAALLHDTGKAQARLRIWHRVAVVLGSRLCPRVLDLLAYRGPRDLAWPLQVALRHAELGAEAARRAGSPERVVGMIREHGLPSTPGDEDDPTEILRRFDSLL